MDGQKGKRGGTWPQDRIKPGSLGVHIIARLDTTHWYLPEDSSMRCTPVLGQASVDLLRGDQYFSKEQTEFPTVHHTEPPTVALLDTPLLLPADHGGVLLNGSLQQPLKDGPLPHDAALFPLTRPVSFNLSSLLLCPRQLFQCPSMLCLLLHRYPEPHTPVLHFSPHALSHRLTHCRLTARFLFPLVAEETEHTAMMLMMLWLSESHSNA
ncbi:hypothetical protein DNTS_024928 [Danionella cerebrum]|uniref:Uncharacterized protein n=1 Tax=Danionella cerebrum TaxID=2873325 RepID=A0A553MVV6_9TELE|nr:hypothetical protein DNTS_024928 [Danionella translucida]